MTVEPLTASVGAEVHGVDLAQPLDGTTIAGIRQALLDHLVLFFRDQDISVDDQLRFARQFGEIDLPLFRTTTSERPEVIMLDQVAPKGQGADCWHADNTYMETPPMGSVLHAQLLPDIGGDTCFASMVAAYDGFSTAMQRFLDGLHAVHSLEQMAERTKHVANASLRDKVAEWPPMVHPVVRVHPETGRKMLNVNRNWTVEIVELSRPESDALLAYCYEHLASPDWQVRFRWRQGDLAFWDNRSVQHYAVADYTARRMMRRVTITGDRPFGVDDPRAQDLVHH